MAFCAPSFASTNDAVEQSVYPIPGAKTYPYQLEVWRMIKGQNGAPTQIQILHREGGTATSAVINSRLAALKRLYPSPAYMVVNTVAIPYEPEAPVVIAPWNPGGSIPFDPNVPFEEYQP
ncbi:hypothetical protein [Myroides odoratus]|uniref:hypothetical protein n=1 Tax=Myroides odoratus TaxID=256 RepID=UPI0039AFC375